MHKQKLIILIAVLVGIISIFLPWFSMPIAGVTEGTEVDYSWLGALIYATIFFPVFAGNQSRPFTSRQKWYSVLKGFLVACFGLLKYSEFKSDITDQGDGNFIARAISETVTVEYGLMLFIGAGIIIALVSLIRFKS